MSEYFLNRERMRVVEKNERGVVTYRKKYVFGNEVDVDHLPDGRLDQLLASGALVESEDDLRTRRSGLVPYPGSQVTGAATAEGADHADLVDEPETDGLQHEESDDDDSPEDVDEFSEMDYQQLQDAARQADPPIAANQSADALRDALRAQG